MKPARFPVAGLFEGGVCVALIALPPLFLAPKLWNALIRRTDGVLAQSAPIASQEISSSLKREVRIGKIRINRLPLLTVDSLWQLTQNRASLGIVPIEIENLQVANGLTLAGSGRLGTAERIVADVSVPALLSGDFENGVPAINLVSPTVLLSRNANGRFNVQDLVPPSKSDEKPTIFRSVITASDSSVTFRDLAAKFPRAQLPATNFLTLPTAQVDLTQTQRILFDMTAQGKRNTATAQRIGGLSRFSGSITRDEIKADTGIVLIKPNRTLIPQAILHTDLADIDLRYWLDYLFDLPGFKLERGRGTANITAVFPKNLPNQRELGINLSGEAAITNGLVTSGALPAPVENVSIRAQFADNLVLVDGKGGFLGSPVIASASLFDLYRDTPQINARLRLPKFSASRYTTALFGVGKTFPAIPRDLKIGETGFVDATLQGALLDPIVSGQVGLSSIGWANYPKATTVAGSFSYARGILGATNIVGNIGGSGKLNAQIAARLAEPTPKGLRPLSDSERALEFEAKLDTIPTAIVAPFLPKTQRKTPLRLAGTTSVQLVGSSQGAKVNLAANITTNGLKVDAIPFSDARARLLVENGNIILPFLSIASPVANARIQGNVDARQNVGLVWRVRSVNVGRIAQVLGVPNAGGILSANGTVSGTVDKPRLTAQNINGIGLRYQTYQTDLLEGDFVATKQALTLGKTVRVTRFPSVATVRGVVTNPLDNPDLNLQVNAIQVPYSEIWAQTQQKGDLPAVGFLSNVTARITGKARFPDTIAATGAVILGETVLADYPITKGALRFEYAKNRTTARDIQVETPFGAVSGVVTLLGNDRLRGSLTAKNLDLAKTPFVPQNEVALEGTVNLAGTLSGTISRPTVTVSATPSDVRIAGIALKDFTLSNLSYTGNAKSKDGRVVLPSLSFSTTDAQFNVNNARYDLKTQRFGAGLSAKIKSIAGLINEFQSSGLTQSAAGNSLATRIGGLPKIDGAVTVADLRITGRTDKKSGIADTEISLIANAQNVSVGRIQNVSVDSELSLKNQQVNIAKLDISDDKTTVRLNGDLNLNEDGIVNLKLDSNEASLDLLREFIPNLPVSGTVNLAAIAQGRRSAPRISASIDSNNLTVRTGDVSKPPIPITLLQIRASLTPQADGTGRISLEDSRIASGSNEIDLRAELPFSYQTQTFIENRPVEASIVLPPQNTALISALVPGLIEKSDKPKSAALETLKPQNAPLFGSLSLSGTLATPQLSGNLSLQNLAFALPKTLGDKKDKINTVRDIQAQIRFDGADVVVQNASVSLGGLNGDRSDYGTITASGKVTLQNLQTCYNEPEGHTPARNHTEYWHD